MAGRGMTTAGGAAFALRMALLGALLLVLFGGIAWMGHRTWSQSAEVRTRFQDIHRVSAWLGHEMSEVVHRLDTRMLRFKLGADPGEWELFQRDLASLREWVAHQSGYLALPGERALVERIDQAIAAYANAGHVFAGATPAVPVPDEVAVQITELSHRSKALVELGLQLANAHQASVDLLLERAAAENARRQRTTQVALGLMVFAGAAMGWLVYRDSVAPLRRRLVESHHRLARQEKLAALGELGAGIAHEIRNPLTAIKARLFTLRKSPGLDRAAAEDAAVIDGEIDRLERIVRDFLGFARPPEPVLAPVDPGALLRRMGALLGPRFEEGEVRLEVEPNTPAPPILADRDQIQQALLNLVRNAADAIASAGRPGLVRLRVLPPAAPARRRGPGLVRFEVADDGPGIEPAIQERLFDPFFTTKANGTGLGLTLTARIAERHGGRVTCRSAPGRGTTFTLLLPAA